MRCARPEPHRHAPGRQVRHALRAVLQHAEVLGSRMDRRERQVRAGRQLQRVGPHVRLVGYVAPDHAVQQDRTRLPRAAGLELGRHPRSVHHGRPDQAARERVLLPFQLRRHRRLGRHAFRGESRVGQELLPEREGDPQCRCCGYSACMQR